MDVIYPLYVYNADEHSLTYYKSSGIDPVKIKLAKDIIINPDDVDSIKRIFKEHCYNFRQSFHIDTPEKFTSEDLMDKKIITVDELIAVDKHRLMAEEIEMMEDIILKCESNSEVYADIHIFKEPYNAVRYKCKSTALKNILKIILDEIKQPYNTDSCEVERSIPFRQQDKNKT